MIRPPWDEYFMLLAKLAATRSTCNSRKIGAVIVKDKQVLATGYNGAMPGQKHCSDEMMVCPECDGGYDHFKSDCWISAPKCKVCNGTGQIPYCHRRITAGLGDVSDNYCRAAHAEANALGQAAANGVSIKDAEVYVTLYPCLPCLKLLSSAHIKGVYYETGYDTGRYYETGQTPDRMGTIQHFTAVAIMPQTLEYILPMLSKVTSGRGVDWDMFKK